MKKVLLSVLASLMAFSCIKYTETVSVFASDAPVTATKDGDTVTIGNEYLSREFSIQDNKLTTTQINNLLGGSTFVPQEGSEEFVIKLFSSVTKNNLPDTLTSVSHQILLQLL